MRQKDSESKKDTTRVRVRDHESERDKQSVRENESERETTSERDNTHTHVDFGTACCLHWSP